jgi:hypothetical protein
MRKRQETPEVAEALATYAHLEGYHAHEWDRFVIEAPDFRTAGRVAAGLGWWLHCWWWEFSESGIVIRDSTGRHAHDPLCGWQTSTDCFPANNCGECSRLAKVRADLINEDPSILDPVEGVDISIRSAARIAVETLNGHRPHGYVCSCGEEINNTSLHLEQVVEAALKAHGRDSA